MSVHQRTSFRRAPAKSDGIILNGSLLGLLAAVLMLGSVGPAAAQDKAVVTIRPAPPRSTHPAPATPAAGQAAASQRRSKRQVAKAHVRRRARKHTTTEPEVAAATPEQPERRVHTTRRSSRTRAATHQPDTEQPGVVAAPSSHADAKSHRKRHSRIASNRDTDPEQDARTADATDAAPRRRRHSRHAETADRSASDSPKEVGSGKGAAGLNTIGFRLIRQHQYAEAEPYLRRAVAKDPNYAYAQYNLGCCLLSEGKPSQALGPLQRSAAQQPERWEPQEKLAEAYRRLNDDERAKAASARAKRLRRNHRSGRAFPSSGPNAAQAAPVRSAIDSNSWRGSTDPKEQRFLTEWRAMR